jgi:hypothetical protein
MSPKIVYYENKIFSGRQKQSAADHFLLHNFFMTLQSVSSRVNTSIELRTTIFTYNGYKITN